MAESIHLAAEPSSVGQARRFCTAVLESWGADDDLVITCALLVSELATNAVLHARTPFSVRLHRRGVVRVEVCDESPHLPHSGDVDVDSPSGRGLRMVEGLSTTSGTTALTDGKSVWFELDWDHDATLVR